MIVSVLILFLFIFLLGTLCFCFYRKPKEQFPTTNNSINTNEGICTECNS